jgi:hypothetical protein
MLRFLTDFQSIGGRSDQEKVPARIRMFGAFVMIEAALSLTTDLSPALGRQQTPNSTPPSLRARSQAHIPIQSLDRQPSSLHHPLKFIPCIRFTINSSYDIYIH